MLVVRIVIISSSLRCGGAERSVVLQAQGFLQRGHHVTLVTLSSNATDFYRMPTGVERVSLDLMKNSSTIFHGGWNNLRRLRALRRVIIGARPNVVISHLDQMNVLTCLALNGTSHPVIAIEHYDPTTLSRGWFWQLLRRLTYPKAARVVSVSRGIDRCFTWLTESQRAVVHNPLAWVNGDTKSLPLEMPVNNKYVVAMGRLTHQKGFDLLLLAFSKLAKQYPDWVLLILGEGELKRALITQASELGLTGRVRFAGLVADPFPVLRNSNLFVMASRYEGFPYVLLEAMASGLPVVYTDCPSGPSEIITHELNGILVPNGDVDALSKAMDRLMNSAEERGRLAAKAPEVRQRFGIEKIMDQWETLLTEVLAAAR